MDKTIQKKVDDLIFFSIVFIFCINKQGVCFGGRHTEERTGQRKGAEVQRARRFYPQMDADFCHKATERTEGLQDQLWNMLHGIAASLSLLAMTE